MFVCVNFEDKILLRRKECKTKLNLIYFFFRKKVKVYIATTVRVANLKFFENSVDKTDLTIGFVLQNLVTHMNFIKFRVSRNFHVFGATGVQWTPNTRILRKILKFGKKFK